MFVHSKALLAAVCVAFMAVPASADPIKVCEGKGPVAEDHGAMITACNAVIKQKLTNGDDAWALENLALSQLAIGELDKALENISKAIAVDSWDAKHYIVRGMIELRRGNFDDAIQDFTDAFARKGWKVEALRQRAMVFEKMDNRERAIADYREMRRLGDIKFAPAGFKRLNWVESEHCN